MRFILAFIAISVLGIGGSIVTTVYIQTAQAESCNQQDDFVVDCQGCALPNRFTDLHSQGNEHSNGKCNHQNR